VLVLGIDTSCDDTSVAVYNARENAVLSNVVSSQHRFHAEFGGVVPEVAARKHAEKIDAVLSTALKEAGVGAKDLELITVTVTPGLMPALLVGLTFAKGLSFCLQKPLKGVHHIEAHMYSPFIGSVPPHPFLALVVSGGHTLMVVAQSFRSYTTVGKTLDDAVGEAYDKVAKLLKLGYPGGPVIDRIFSNYSGEFLKLPKPKVPGLNLSFSGLKTAVRRLVEKGYPPVQVAVSFQKTAVEYIVEKLRRALAETGVKAVAVSGGVSANSLLREKLRLLEEEGYKVFLPEPSYTTDNGAMVAYTGYRRFLAEGEDPITLTAEPRKNIEEW